MDAKNRVKDDSRIQDEPQVIAEFRINSERDRKTQIIEEYSTCYLCGSELDFTHISNFIQLEVIEEAHCPCCHIRTKKDLHRLQ